MKVRKILLEVVDTFCEGLELSRKEFYEKFNVEDDKEIVDQLNYPLKK